MKFAFLILIVTKFYDDADLTAYTTKYFQLSVPIVSTTGPLPLEVCDAIVKDMNKHNDLVALCQEIK